ncbi:MAG TPA: hypothetical protein VJ761_17950 [Ktedonobacteraceae bacterium]|nr:hypothetical protein [Ktedonobacteraceae bacterium]
MSKSFQVISIQVREARLPDGQAMKEALSHVILSEAKNRQASFPTRR